MTIGSRDFAAVPVLIYPVSVQGSAAAGEITAALRLAGVFGLFGRWTLRHRMMQSRAARDPVWRERYERYAEQRKQREVEEPTDQVLRGRSLWISAVARSRRSTRTSTRSTTSSARPVQNATGHGVRRGRT